jgi:hypothetical protein
MNFDGGQLARAMMSIHEAELEQSARYPGTNLSARIERRIVLRRRGNRTLCRLRGLLVTIGRRLQQYGLSQPLRLEGDAAPVEGTGSC